jgi:hypothetical protein
LNDPGKNWRHDLRLGGFEGEAIKGDRYHIQHGVSAGISAQRYIFILGKWMKMPKCNSKIIVFSTCHVRVSRF